MSPPEQEPNDDHRFGKPEVGWGGHGGGHDGGRVDDKRWRQHAVGIKVTSEHE